MHEIVECAHDARKILLNQLSSWLAEDDVDLLQSLVLSFWHEQQLVDPSHDSDTSVEAQREPDLGHGLLHLCEEVRDQERAEEERHIGCLHSIGPQVRWIDLRWDDPSQAGVRTKEALVDDEARDVGALGTRKIRLQVNEVAAPNNDEANKEARKHSTSPESASELLHVEDGGNGSEKETAAAHE